jgi:hypothetical protein
MKLRILRKIVSFIATVALLFNSLGAPFAVIATDEPTPSPTTEETLVPASTTTTTPTTDPIESSEASLSSTIEESLILTATSEAFLTSVENNALAEQSNKITYTSVSLNTQYFYKDTKVSVTFTKLPETPNDLTIEEIILTPEQMENSKALSDKAYDITSTMDNGTFEYNLTLPKPESNDLEVKFSEDGQNFVTSGGVSTTDSEVLVSNIDHFTIFVVANPTKSTQTDFWGKVEWDNKNKIYTSDDKYAKVYLSLGLRSETLQVTNFDLSIPSNAIIEGIVVNIERKASPERSKESKDYIVRLIKNGEAVGNNLASDEKYPTIDAYQKYGSKNYLWGETWTPADLNNPSFGVAFAAQGNTVFGQWIEVDHIEVKVFYNTVPAITVISPNGDEIYAGSSNQDIFWNASDIDGDTLQIKLEYTTDGINYQPIEDNLPNTGSYSWTVPKIDSSTVKVRATVSDEDLNISDSSDADFTIDSSGPFAPDILFPNENDWFTTQPILNDWGDAYDSSGINYYRIEYQYDDHHTFPDAPYRTSTLSQRNHLPNSNEQGGVRFRVQAFDNLNNEGVWSEWRHYYYDATAPTTTLTSPLGKSIWKTSINISGISTDNLFTKLVNISWRMAGENVWNLLSTLTNSNPNKIFDWDTFWNPSIDGVYDIKASAVDEADNEETTAYVYSVTYDTTAPDVAITSPTEISVKGIVPIYGTVSDINPDHYWLVIQDSSGTTVAGPEVVYDKSSFEDKLIFNWDTSSIPYGTYVIKLEARDAAGNKDNGSIEWKTIIVDNTAPAKPIGLTRFTPDKINEYGCGAMSKRQTLIPTWSANNDSDFSHYEYTSFNPNGSIGINEQILTTNEFVHTWVPTSDGTYGYAVRAVDYVGNKSDWALTSKTLAGSCQITYDSTAPEIPVLNSPANGAVVNGNPKQSWSLIPDAHHYIYASYFDESGNDSSLIYTTSITSNSRTVGGTQTITFYWRVKAVDVVGNESGWSEMRKLTVDNNVPTISNLEVNPQFYIKAGDTLNVSADVTDFSGISAVSADFSYNNSYTNRPNPTSTTMTKISGNSYQVHYLVPTSWNEGLMYIKVAAKDKTGGNWVRSIDTKIVTVDNTSPTTPMATPVAGDYTSIQSVTLTSSDGGSGLKNIFYTTDESTPDDTSLSYTDAIIIDQDTIIKAIAYDNAGNASDILEAVYRITPTILASSVANGGDGGGDGLGCANHDCSTHPQVLGISATDNSTTTPESTYTGSDPTVVLEVETTKETQESDNNEDKGDSNVLGASINKNRYLWLLLLLTIPIYYGIRGILRKK